MSSQNRNGMNTPLLNNRVTSRDVHVTDDSLAIDLADGRTIIVTLTWHPRLSSAATERRSHWKASVAGYEIHWPEIGEDLSTEGLLRGAPAALSRTVAENCSSRAAMLNLWRPST